LYVKIYKPDPIRHSVLNGDGETIDPAKALLRVRWQELQNALVFEESLPMIKSIEDEYQNQDKPLCSSKLYLFSHKGSAHYEQEKSFVNKESYL
jgi:hypothetical protein